MAKKPEKTDEPQAAGHNFAKAHLKSFVDRLERLDEEKTAITDDIKDVYNEAASQGFDKKVLRALIRRRKQDANELAEFEALLDTYRHALGDLATTPLGEAAMKKASNTAAPTPA